MLRNEKSNAESKMAAEDRTLNSEQNIHAVGLEYVCRVLDRAGFAILEVNADPEHHFQLLAKVNDKSHLIAVRSAYEPEVGRIDQSTMEKLIREAEVHNAMPHFAGLTVTPVKRNDTKVEGKTGGQEFKVIFNGISAIRKSDVLLANS